ncbi:MAG TPA: choice-of-anchor X domain-containing protein [Candidatus Limnocylindria bacterium]|nr:choice-of-anchor X domain-containing protein [Candidatus Limnocylindria bacterium]
MKTLPTLSAFRLACLMFAAWLACTFHVPADTGQTQLSTPLFQGNEVKFDWNSGGELQTAPGPDGPWTTVAAPQAKSSTSTVPFTPGTLFFRVVDKGIPGEVKPIVEGDARRPLRVQSATIRKGASANGNAFIEAILEPGQNPPVAFTLLQDGELVTLRDDGQGGDTKAGDGIFTGAIFVDRNEFAAGNEFIDALPPEFQVIGSFDGRNVTATRPPALFDLDAFDRGQPVPILPTPFDGKGAPTQLTKRKLAAAKRSGARPAAQINQEIAITNLFPLTNVVCNPVLIGTNDAPLLTNIVCNPVVIGTGTGSFVTNVVCEPTVIGHRERSVTNVICETVQIGTEPPPVRTNVDCVQVVIDPLPQPGITNVCVTNLVMNPVRLVPQVICEEVKAGPDGKPSGAVVCTTNFVMVADGPEFTTNVMCLDFRFDGSTGAPIVTNFCVTNLFVDTAPVPIFTNVCTTNIVLVADGDPIVTNVCTTNVVFVAAGDPITTNVCVTNIVSNGTPTPVFTNVCLTNITFTTNISFTNIVSDPLDTNIDIYLGRPIFWPKSLLITDLSVIEDPTRTFDPCTPDRGTKMGAWTFGRLMSDVCNQPVTGIEPGEFARRWLRSWITDQVINFDTVTNRQVEIVKQVLTDWEAASGGPDKPLDMGIAPFRLLAIVNRVDLRGNPGYGGIINDDPCNPVNIGGEGRFVFCLIPGLHATEGGGTGYGGGGGGGVSGSCDASQFTVIFEYAVPKNTCAEIKSYGLEWYNLNRMPFGPEFNAALQHITDQFAAAGADPRRKPNLSALSQLRANELLREPWELREWRLFPNDSDTGWLREVTAKQTPDFDHNFQPIITEYCAANAGLILAEKHLVPLMWRTPGKPMVPFLGGSAPMATQDFFWDGAPRGSIPTDIRHKFSLNTCNGCHSGETGTPFTHVFPRKAGAPTQLSDFLTGLNMPKLDPADHVTPRTFADLKRREDDLLKLISEPCFFQLFTEPPGFTH